MTLAVIIDNRADSRQKLARLLKGEGLSVVEAADGAEALHLTFHARPDVAVVDLEVSIGGVGLVRILRAACAIPIVALADGRDPAQVVDALDAGADDVIPRGCDSQEFLARTRAAMRRRADHATAQEAAPRIVRTGNLTIDRDARTVTKHDGPVALSRTEYLMVDALAARLGEVAPHRYLLTQVWGEAFVDDVQYLRVYIGYLRQKLEDDPTAPQYFVNDWGVGYHLARLPIAIREPSPKAQRTTSALAYATA